MFIILNEQIIKFKEIAKEKFIRSKLELFPQHNYEQILTIVNEALTFKIEVDLQVLIYVNLYLNYNSLFTNKPSWMLYILKNENYPPAEKLTFIESEIIKSDVEFKRQSS